MEQKADLVGRIEAIEQRILADTFWEKLESVLGIALLLALNFVVALLFIPKADAFLSGMQSAHHVHVPLLTRGVVRLAWVSVAIDFVLFAALGIACLRGADTGKVRGIALAALGIMVLKFLLFFVGLLLPSFEIVQALSR
jgi:hypothetical protein